MPQAKSSEKYQAPPINLITPIFLAVGVPSACPAADIRVYLQLWDFVLYSFFLLKLRVFVLCFVSFHHLRDFMFHWFFLLFIMDFLRISLSRQG